MATTNYNVSPEMAKVVNIIRGGSSATPISAGTYSAGQLRDSAGNYTVPATKSTEPIKATDMGTTAIQTPAPTTTPTYAYTAPSIASGANPTTGLFENNTTTKTGEIISPQTKTTSDYLNEYLGLIKPPASTAESYNKAYTESGIQQAQQQKNNTQSLINNITSTANANSLAVTGQGRGIPEVIIGGQQAQIAKEATIKLLPLQAQLATDQGNLELAQSHLDTLFKIYTDDAKQQVDYYNKAVELAYDSFTKDEQRRLDDIRLQKQQDFEMKKSNIEFQRSLGKAASDSGQQNLATNIYSLDPSSSDYNQSLSELAGQVQMSPSVKLDIALKQAQLAKTQKETLLLGEPTEKEKKAIADSVKEASSSAQVLQDKIDTIDSLANNPGLGSRVGTSFLSRTPYSTGGIISGAKVLAQDILKAPLTLGVGSYKDISGSLSGSGQDFSGGIHKLVSGLSIDNLIAAKARGATFGALSDAELNMLSNSASAINDWEIKDDKGKGIGIWNIDEDSFKKELNTIKSLSQKALLDSKGTLLTPEESSLLDNTFKANNNVLVAPSNYYN